MKTRKQFSVLAIALVAACGDGSEDCPGRAACAATGDAGSDASSDTGDANTDTPDADFSGSNPRFLSLGTNATSISPGESITFTAVLTDPDGIDDLIGGTLFATGNQTQQYGAFTAGAQEGAYELTVSWSEMNQLAPIEFVGNSSARKFTAIFYDSAGHSVQRIITIDLTCKSGSGACDGQCTFLDTDSNHCGACGNACASSASCESGVCVTYVSSPFAQSCDDICSAKALTCSASCLTQSGTIYAAWTRYFDWPTLESADKLDMSCSAVPPSVFQGLDFLDQTCCCL